MQRLFHILLVLLLNTSSLDLQSQWHDHAPYADEFDDIQMVDYLNGYAVGRDNGIGSCGPSISAVFRTMDGGKNWSRNALDDSHEMTSVFFLNQSLGWASGYYGDSYKTTDCGQTWTLYDTGIGNTINDIFFVNETTGFAVGDQGHIRKSSNGGSSWTFNFDQGGASMREVEFYDEQFGFVVGTQGTILRTEDSGNSWTSYDTGNSVTFFDIHFIDDQNIFLTSYDAIYRTEDGGLNWTEIPLEGLYAIRSIYFTSDMVGYIGGELGQLWKTEDGGENWTSMDFPFDETIYAIQFLDSDVGYMSTNRAGIFHTSDAGQTWENQHTGIKVPVVSGSTDDLRDVDYLNKDTAVVVGGSGNICMTFNGGLSWSRMQSGSSELLSAVQWIDSEKILVVGTQGTLLKTEDTGQSWTQIPIPSEQFLIDIWFSDDGQVGYLLGQSGEIIKTLDAGDTWEVQEPIDGAFYRDFDFLDAEYGLVVGSDRVLRTLDGGETWTEQPYYNAASSLRCVTIVSDSLSYLGSTNILMSTNGGEFWDERSTSTSLFANRIEFLNDSLGYLIFGANVRVTHDSAKTWGSVSTACLNNSWDLAALEIVDEEHIYVVGDSPMRRAWAGPVSIETRVEGSSFCLGEKINIGYSYDGAYTSSNTYEAQLSDLNGDFSSPIPIGSYTSDFVSIDPSGVISCSIPAGLPEGTGYRIRVVATSPEHIGQDNGFDIQLLSSLDPSISLDMILPECGEGPLSFISSVSEGGTMQYYTWSVNDSTVLHNAAQWSTQDLTVGDSVQMTMSIESACTTADVVSNVLVVPEPMLPMMTLTDDLSVMPGEAVVLSAAGMTSYLWEPATYLDADDISSPTCTPDTTITYWVTGVDDNGCSLTDSVTVSVIPDVVDGIDEEEISFLLSPNPAGPILSVQLKNHLMADMIVLDALGQEVLRASLNGDKTELDISGLKDGNYFLWIKGEKREGMKKFLKD